MASFKRPRSLSRTHPSNAPSIEQLPVSRRLVVTVLFCFQLISVPSVTNAFTVSGQPPAAHRNSMTALFSPLFATSSTEISRRKNRSKPINMKSHVANLPLFKTYNEYKSIQERLAELNVSEKSIVEQASALNLSTSTLETILMNGYNARQTLLLDNIPLVHHTVKKLTKSQLNSLSKEDLIQEGTIGLIKAIDKFDASLGNAFSTYAVYWIRASVLRCIQQKEDIIRVPEYLEKAIRMVDLALKDEGQINWEAKDMYASVDMIQLAKSSGLTPRVVEEALKVKQRRIRQASRKEGYSELQDYMMKGARFQQQNEMTNGIAREGQLDHFKDILGQFLSMKEMEAISWRYGLLQEAQAAMGTSRIPEPVQVDIRECRDYEAEAENDLFGTGGILGSSQSLGAVPAKASSTIDATVVKGPKAKITVASSTSAPAHVKGGRWGEAMSFKEVGENMRVSAEYGRRLCSSALKKLQAAAEEGRLDPAMLF